jgi:glycosyltransferase involved in cell wall biosynthesis
MKGDFSVLLSIYQKERAEFLVESLDSIFNQTLNPNEVILVKDGPLTNELDEVINRYRNRYKELKIISLPENKGLPAALNEGLKHCSYELVARMDTDDIAKRNRFEKQIQFLEKNPNIDVFGTDVDEFDDNISNLKFRKIMPKTETEFYSFSKNRNPIIHPTVMFKKNAVLSIGGYKNYMLFEDYHLWVRMLVKGYRFYNLDDSLLYFRFSKDTYYRRTGWKYAMTGFELEWDFFRLGFLKLHELFLYSPVKFIIRLCPISLKILFYKYILRRK